MYIPIYTTESRTFSGRIKGHFVGATHRAGEIDITHAECAYILSRGAFKIDSVPHRCFRHGGFFTFFIASHIICVRVRDSQMRDEAGRWSFLLYMYIFTSHITQDKTIMCQRGNKAKSSRVHLRKACRSQFGCGRSGFVNSLLQQRAKLLEIIAFGMMRISSRSSYEPFSDV